jgi:hypothetical protein
MEKNALKFTKNRAAPNCWYLCRDYSQPRPTNPNRNGSLRSPDLGGSRDKSRLVPTRFFMRL